MPKIEEPEESKSAASSCFEGFRLEDHFDSPRKRVSGDRFIKRLRRPTRPFWLAWFRRLKASRSMREMRCYDILRRIGVPCPRDVQVHEERSFLGFLRYSEISMELIRDAVDLKFLATLSCFSGLIENTRWRKAVVRTAARWIRHMHENGFYNSKLHFGNIMVVPDPEAPEVKMYFIDVTGGPLSFLATRDRSRMKDVAYLYPDAMRWCTPRERILFMHEFLGTRKLSDSHRRFIDDIIRYSTRKKKIKAYLSQRRRASKANVNNYFK